MTTIPMQKNNIHEYSILLATYNGARYIQEYLESCPWPEQADLIVHDDGSTDDTLTIIEDFAQKNVVKHKIYTDEHLGAKESFAFLLEMLEKPYFVFADQDDIWEQEKIPTLLKAIHELELQYGKDTPLLVYSDASLMRSSGEVYHNSFLRAAGIPCRWNEDFQKVIVMPHVLGCTMLGNKALAKASLPIAHEAIMHDAWVLQVACALGHVKEVNTPLIRYRQHDSNVFGAKELTWRSIVKRILDGRKSKYDKIVQSQRQAKALLAHCGHLMSQKNYELCKAWAEVEHKSWLGRRITYAKYGFSKAGFWHNAVLWTCG